MNDAAHAVWTEDGKTQSALWRSENATKVPQRIVVADDRLTADAAYRYACEGTAMLWRGDYQNARQLLQAMARRIDKKPARK
ncbi:MAG: methyltransferase, partial [Betaproteobacteria bacterium HGW-Betaproteobacteria-2]